MSFRSAKRKRLIRRCRTSGGAYTILDEARFENEASWHRILWPRKELWLEMVNEHAWSRSKDKITRRSCGSRDRCDHFWSGSSYFSRKIDFARNPWKTPFASM